MQHLHGHKIAALLVICLLTGVTSMAQREWNLPGHEDKPYYFGIVLGYNTSHYNITHHPVFLQRDTIQSINSLNSGRVHLGILANWQMSPRFDLRFYPLNLIFSEKRFRYTETDPGTGELGAPQDRNVESIVMSFPLQFRLKSDRIRNFKVYTLAGAKYDFDLASNAGARNSENMVKVKGSDFGVEGGIGFQFFFKYFIFSPEVKLSYGLSNVHARDETLRYSNVIDRMNSRMIMFSLHFEGGGLGF
jgi:hypothetical protein